MADIPFLELARLGFQMKLQSEGVLAEAEGLVLVIGVRGKSFGLRGEIECIAVPVQDG